MNIFIIWWLAAGLLAAAIAYLVALIKKPVDFSLGFFIGALIGLGINLVFGPFALIGALFILQKELK